MNEYISVSELLRRLPIGKTKAYQLLASGDIPNVKVGSRVLVSVQGLAVYLDNCTRTKHRLPKVTSKVAIPSLKTRHAFNPL